MSKAAIGMIPEDSHCPRSPIMRPLKLKAQLLETKDFLSLPERANASAMKEKRSDNQPSKPKKTIMNFLREKEAVHRWLKEFFNDLTYSLFFYYFLFNEQLNGYLSVHLQTSVKLM